MTQCRNDSGQGEAMAGMTVGRRMKRRFYQMLELGSVKTVYQPVVSMSDSSIIGHEALSRGPIPDLVSPAILFQVAAQESASSRLDVLCCRSAIEHFSTHGRQNGLLFINLLPETLETGALDVSQLTDWVQSHGMRPDRVVLEVTEKEMCDPAAFYTGVSRLRQAGFGFAVDDVGTGQSNLALLCDLVPEFIKLDLEFVRLTRMRPVRRKLVESLVQFADKIGAMMVAEGIESSSDAEVFRLLGVPLAQGFLYRSA